MGGRGGAATPQYEKWEGERRFPPPSHNCFNNIYNYCILGILLVLKYLSE